MTANLPTIFCEAKFDLTGLGQCSHERDCRRCDILPGYVEELREYMENQWNMEVTIEWLCTGCIDQLKDNPKFLLGYYGLIGECTRCGSADFFIANLTLLPRR